ncbi:MAG TPA: hypothetical protein VMT67_17285 [Terriglobales bacterium]|nr:hypothetical protein [Terriglobales bacterium]
MSVHTKVIHLRDLKGCCSPRYDEVRCGGRFLKLQKIISYSTLAISVVTLILVLRRPAPVAAPVAPAAAVANAQSFQEKLDKLAQPRTPEGPPEEVRMNSGEINAALAQAAGTLAASANTSAPSSPSGSGGSMNFPGPVPDVKDYQVSMDGDLVRGQFLTQIAGKDVYLTLAGHLGSKDGYATFDATEVKIGDLSIPASLVNQALQKKLNEQRDQIKLPANVKDIRVENGELVFVEK